MTGPLSVFEMIGFAVVVFGTAMTAAVTLVLAAFGAHTLWRFTVKGAEVYELNAKAGSEVREKLLQ